MTLVCRPLEKQRNAGQRWQRDDQNMGRQGNQLDGGSNRAGLDGRVCPRRKTGQRSEVNRRCFVLFAERSRVMESKGRTCG